jgi:hypothetical protein
VARDLYARDACDCGGAGIPCEGCSNESPPQKSGMVVEKWETIAHLKEHMVVPHMQDYRLKVKDFVKSVELRVLSPVREMES